MADLISGSWPGEIFWFPGTDNRGFGERQVLHEKIQTTVNGRTRAVNASSVAVADWDGDGDFDLIVGGISGGVLFIANTGSKSAPQWAEPVAMQTAGESPRAVGEGHHTSAVAADWDLDGDLDLIAAHSAGINLYRNIGTRTEPKLGPAEALAPASGAKISTGSRFKAAVTDFNADGLPDLLVGDFAYTRNADGRSSSYAGNVYVLLRQPAPADNSADGDGTSDDSTDR